MESNAGATAGFADSRGDGVSRFGPIAGRGGGAGGEFDDPASKRSKVAGPGRMEVDNGADMASRRSPEGQPSEHADSDSDSNDDRKDKKKKKKKKKKHKHRDEGPAAPVRLGAPQKLGTSQSEPSVGCKPLSEAGSVPPGGSPRSNGGAPAGGPAGAAGGSAAPHPALGGLSPLDEN